MISDWYLLFFENYLSQSHNTCSPQRVGAQARNSNEVGLFESYIDPDIIAEKV